MGVYDYITLGCAIVLTVGFFPIILGLWAIGYVATLIKVKYGHQAESQGIYPRIAEKE